MVTPQAHHSVGLGGLATAVQQLHQLLSQSVFHIGAAAFCLRPSLLRCREAPGHTAHIPEHASHLRTQQIGIFRQIEGLTQAVICNTWGGRLAWERAPGSSSPAEREWAHMQGGNIPLSCTALAVSSRASGARNLEVAAFFYLGCDTLPLWLVG